MSDGRPYLVDGVPSPVMGKSYKLGTQVSVVRLLLTGSRLAAWVPTTSTVDGLVEGDDTDLLVWDWKTGKTYLVSHLTFISLCGTSDPRNCQRSAFNQRF